jgi:hypothetical protein
MREQTDKTTASEGTQGRDGAEDAGDESGVADPESSRADRACEARSGGPAGPTPERDGREGAIGPAQDEDRMSGELSDQSGEQARWMALASAVNTCFVAAAEQTKTPGEKAIVEAKGYEVSRCLAGYAFDPWECSGRPLCKEEVSALCEVLGELEWHRYNDAGLKDTTSAAVSGSPEAAIEKFDHVSVTIGLWLRYSDMNAGQWMSIRERWVILRNVLTDERMSLRQKVAAVSYKGVADVREGRVRLPPPPGLAEKPLVAGCGWWEEMLRSFDTHPAARRD